MQNLSLKAGLLLGVSLFLTPAIASPQDPLERFNREITLFNHDMDACFLKPIAETYKKITPWFVREGLTHFFSNLNEIPTIANDLLQVKPKQALADTGRFLINSTFGLAGFVDVASAMRIKHNTQDFGLTLARWGWKESTYVVLPFLGPKTIRDAIGLPVNYYGLSVYPSIRPHSAAYEMSALDKLNMRANYLGVEDIVQVAALDQYVFMRDAYLQRRNATIDNSQPVLAESAKNKDSSQESAEQSDDDFADDEE